MAVTADALRMHLDYSGWANRRLVAAARELPADALHRDFGTSGRTISGTLGHVLASEAVWLARLTSGPKPLVVSETTWTLETIEKEWPPLEESWKRWGAGLGDEDARNLVTYRDLKGNPWTQPVWQIVLHAVNHGTHHRGQVSGFVRALGRTPPPLDLIRYYRELC